MTDARAPSEQAVSLEDRMAVACGHLNACFAALVELVEEVVATDAWEGIGIRSVEQWLVWRTGLSYPHVRSLLAVAAAKQTHPEAYAAFAAGELSIDQAGLAIKARPQHDGDVAVWARSMTLSQLRLAVRASNVSAEDVERCRAKGAEVVAEIAGHDGRAESADDLCAAGGEHGVNGPHQLGRESEAEPPAAPPWTGREYVSLVQDEDGSWRLNGRFDADHGAIVDAALSEARDRLFDEGDRKVAWIDALIDLCGRSLEGLSVPRRERFRINLFLDPEHSPAATWTNGIAVPDAITRLLTCEGLISPVFVRNGHPVSVGRSQHIVPDRTRRVVLHRDKQCRNPLCGAGRGLEVHHLHHWSDGGRTDTSNLCALCRRCHRQHHAGRLEISGDADDLDGLVFRDERGRPLDTATHARAPQGPPPEPERPYRHPLGEPLQRWAIVFNPRRPSPN